MGDSKINVLRGRKLSLENAGLIGTGATCKVYLLPDDNVVKVLFSTDYQEAEREILLSKWAFLKGFATAISYDVVDVDGHPGLVYESLGRDNLRNHLRDNPDNLTPLLERYLAFIKANNAIEVGDGELPRAKDKVFAELQTVKAYLTEEEYAKILRLLDTIPEDNHIVHGDSHMKNIKMVGDKMFLIDLDTLSVGDPIFELNGLCCGYHAYAELNLDEKGYNAFFEIDNDIIDKTFAYLVENYFPNIADRDKKENLEKVKLLTYIRMLYNLNPNDEGEKAFFADMLRRVREGLEQIDNLVLKR